MSTPRSEIMKRFRPTVAEIDVDAFARNLAAVRARLTERVKLIAVVKADAYGHGAVPLAKRCEREGVTVLAVALLEEALELRTAGVTLPILILGPLTDSQLPLISARNFIVGVVGPEQLAEVCAMAGETRHIVPIHLKLDTGMSRMGLVPEDLYAAAEMIRNSPYVSVEAIYTHFANASDPDDPFTARQIVLFERMVRVLAGHGVRAPSHHLANSAATMLGHFGPGDFARVGLSLYGAEPLDKGASRLEPVMRWVTRIARVKRLPMRVGIGYGTTFRTDRESTIATLPVGYADGYDRLFSNKGEVLIGGHRAPVVGRVSMDLVTVDVTDLAQAAVGDEVVLLGAQGTEQITAEELATKSGTISYEIFCNVSGRVPRLYTDDGSVELRSRFNRVF